MRILLMAFWLLLASVPAFANPALHGTWSAVANGQPMIVNFSANGTGTVDGQAMRWQTLGPMLFIEQDGDTGTYTYQLEGQKLNVSGGDFTGTVVFSRGTAAAKAAKAGRGGQRAAGQAGFEGGGSGGQELVGKWCKGGSFSANSGGGLSSMTCFELRADGSYSYQHEGSVSAYSSGMYGGSNSQSSDAGRWSVSGNRLTARSQSGEVNTYTLEKRNARNRDAMLCLDGECYTTYWQRPSW
jgi:hypothetical protein